MTFEDWQYNRLHKRWEIRQQGKLVAYFERTLFSTDAQGHDQYICVVGTGTNYTTHTYTGTLKKAKWVFANWATPMPTPTLVLCTTCWQQKPCEMKRHPEQGYWLAYFNGALSCLGAGVCASCLGEGGPHGD